MGIKHSLTEEELEIHLLAAELGSQNALSVLKNYFSNSNIMNIKRSTGNFNL